MMIDFFKIVAALNIIPASLLWGFLLVVLFWFVLAFVEIDWEKDKIKRSFILFLWILIAITPYLFMKNFGNQRAKAVLKKYNASNVKNLKSNIKIIRNIVKFNTAIKDKDEYVNRILNKFYVDGKDVTLNEKELMKKLKK
jgi:hypothetical protein